MLLTVEKLKVRIPQIISASVRQAVSISGITVYDVVGEGNAVGLGEIPARDATGWRSLEAGERWGSPDAPMLLDGDVAPMGGSNHWLRVPISIADDWRGTPVYLALGERWNMTYGSEKLIGVEAIGYWGDQILAGFDYYHPDVRLPDGVHQSATELLIRCVVRSYQLFHGVKVIRRDDPIYRLGILMQTVLDSLKTYSDTDRTKHILLERLNHAYNMLDLRCGWNDEMFVHSAHETLVWLDQHLYENLQQGERPHFIVTGHAHLDTAWLWPLWRTRQKAIHTVATALSLMDRYPDYQFSMSQPQIYNFLKADAPELYERMKARISEGRFEPVGMMWVEADCNIPSGESLVRQLQHGSRFFNQEFGQRNHILWLPDVFGYSAAIPQLLRSVGIDSFMTTKISWNQFNRMPHDTFRWRGIDGSEVLTHFVTATAAPVGNPSQTQFYTYNGNASPEEVAGTWSHYRDKTINNELLYITGWGDGGGGPTEEMLEAVQVMQELPGFPSIRFGNIMDFFERLYQRVWTNPALPIWSGELYLEYHRGTYTAQAKIKQNNRDAELLYREAEWLNTWAMSLGAANQQAQLDAGWSLILLNQFHDILPGSSIGEVYKDSAQQFTEVRRLANDVIQNALNSIMQDKKMDLVFNSLPWERHDVVQIPIGMASGDLAGQIIDSDGQKMLLVEVNAPSYGYTGVGATDSMDRSDKRFSVSNNLLENDEFRIELNEHGEIASLRDLRYGHEIVAAGSTANQLVTYEDRPLYWSAWDIDIFYPEKAYPVRDIVDWQLVEDGPLCAAVKIVRRVGSSTITQRIRLWRHSRRIDFITEVDWQERETLLRVLFPLNINSNRATCEIQFGAVERPTHQNTSWDWARFEVCAHRWVDLSEGNYGVALLNTGKYGHSLEHHVIGLSLLKGSVHPDPDADLGNHRFTYSLLPHRGDWREGQVVRRAYELNTPLRFVKSLQSQALEIKSQPIDLSFVKVDADHVVVETIKAADDGNGFIVRLYESHNQRGEVTLTFAQPIIRAILVDLLERELESVVVVNNEAHFDVRPFEVKTLRIELGMK